MENKLISVIMSVYNNEDTLEESIISILDQTHKNIEFLITDDGSTDNSYQIISYIMLIKSKVFDRHYIPRNINIDLLNV